MAGLMKAMLEQRVTLHTRGLRTTPATRFLDSRPADVGWLRRAAGSVGIRHREGLTFTRKAAPSAWAASRKGSMLESPLLAYRPLEGTPDIMIVHVGASTGCGHAALSSQPYEQPLQIGDLVRVTDSVFDNDNALGINTAAVRAGTVGVVEDWTAPDRPIVRFTGYFDHPLGLPMVMEQAHGDMWSKRRELCGPVQRILPTGELAGPETGVLLTAGGEQGYLAAAGARGALDLRDLHGGLARDTPSMEVPLALLEVSDGTTWQPVGPHTAARREAMAPIYEASMPYLRRISEARKSGDMPLLGFGHGESFLKPGGETSMAHDAPVLCYDGSGVGREFNLLYIDEEAQAAVVGMGSASGALYSANISLRMLPLSDVYIPYSKAVSQSMPLGKLLTGVLGEALRELHGRPGEETTRATVPYFKHLGKPLPPGDDSLLASLLGLFFGGSSSDGAGGGWDANESVGRAWERLRSECVTQLSEAALANEIAESGSIRLPLDLLCVHVDGKDLPIYIDIFTDESSG